MRALLLLFPLFAFAATDWNALLDQGDGSHVQFGATIGGDGEFQRDATSLYAPASTAKLLTAGALLSAVGPDFRYPTTLRWNELAPGVASALSLVGTGDPSWALSELKEGLRDRLDSFAIALKAADITTVQGDPLAVAADPRWNTITPPEGWKPTDTTGCDGALAQAFNLSLNCATLRISSATHAAWDQPGLAYPVHLALQSGSATSLAARFTGAGFAIEGTWKSGTPAQTLTLPIYDTRPWVTALFRQALAAQGIRLLPGFRLRVGAPKQLVFYSPPLSELVKPFLKNSINVMSDAFLKTLAALVPGAGGDLLSPGLDRLGSFLRDYGNARDFDLHDGSGLSRTSRVSPAFLFAYLSRIPNAPWFPALYDALPVAGVDGTLKNRMKGTPAEGVLRAKTGTLDGVYNLAGYVPRGKGFVPFVLLTRTTPDHSAGAKAAEDRVGVKLAEIYSEPAADLEKVVAYPFVREHAGGEAE